MIFLYIGIFIAALIAIIYGGNLFVDNSIVIAKRSKIPMVIIGATIVSIATTMPELIVSSIAAAGGSYSLSVGNALGSVIINTGIVGGLSIAFMPSIIKEKSSPIKYFILIGTIVLLFILGFNKNGNYSIHWIEALIFIIVFIGFILFNTFDAVSQQKTIKSIPEKQQTQKQHKLSIAILLFLAGAALVAVGSYGLVESATYIACAIGVSEAFIGLTIIAFGTSLPELVTTIISLKKKNTELGYGNIIGANILNIALIMGTSGLISGSALPITKYTYLVSIPVALLLSLIFLLPMIIKKRTYRWQGISLICGYALYFAFLVVMTCLKYTV